MYGVPMAIFLGQLGGAVGGPCGDGREQQRQGENGAGGAPDHYFSFAFFLREVLMTTLDTRAAPGGGTA